MEVSIKEGFRRWFIGVHQKRLIKFILTTLNQIFCCSKGLRLIFETLIKKLYFKMYICDWTHFPGHSTDFGMIFIINIKFVIKFGLSTLRSPLLRY